MSASEQRDCLPWFMKTNDVKEECREWKSFSVDFPDFDACWTAVHWGDWLMWYLGRISSAPDGDRRRSVVSVACDVAEAFALEHVEPARRATAERALRTARDWSSGNTTVEAVHAARRELLADAWLGIHCRYPFDEAKQRWWFAAQSVAHATRPSPPFPRASYSFVVSAAGYATAFAFGGSGFRRVDVNVRAADLIRTKFPSPPGADPEVA